MTVRMTSFGIVPAIATALLLLTASATAHPVNGAKGKPSSE